MLKSNLKTKKFMVKVDGKTVHFGGHGYNDYTTYSRTLGKKEADIKKKNYILRHKKNEDWSNLFTAGFWSRWILWNKPTLMGSIKDLAKKMDTKIYYYP